MWLGGSSGSGLWKNDREIAGSLLFYFKDGGGCCLNVKLKKVLCVALTLLLSVNTLFSYVVYADQGFDDLFISPTPTPKPPLVAVDIDKLPGWQAQQDEMMKLNSWFMSLFAGSAPVMKEWGASAAQTMQELFNKLLASDEIKTDGDNLYITQNGVDQINDTVQDSVYRFDGYYLIEPSYSLDYDTCLSVFSKRISRYSSTSLKRIEDYVASYGTAFFETSKWENNYFFGLVGFNTSGNDGYFYINPGGQINIYYSDNNKISLYFPSYLWLYDDGVNLSEGVSGGIYPYSNYRKFMGEYTFMGAPFKIFYSLQDLENYLNKGRRYVPKLPSQIIRIPTKVINNTPNITYNITTENKTENDIQNEYNQQLIEYITNLYPSSGNPTPTPTPIISDGEPTPTPTPDWGDGSVTPTPAPGTDMTETNDWLKKIYELLEKFYNAYKEFTDKLSDYLDNNDAFFKKVSEYLEKYDGKLDQIVDALDKIAQGKDEGDEKGCQYDYKELSEFLTKLWNDSDKKFDDMIDLLEENNEYQEKMLSTLNSIKNILRAQSVMDTFKNRSKETANKAKEKFPTSVPWDIAMIVNAMDAEPEDPVFLLPIKIERLGIDEEIKVDLSTGEWEKLAKACRYMLTLLFILFMIRLSMKLFSGKDDD